jgi:hypothetical protein
MEGSMERHYKLFFIVIGIGALTISTRMYTSNVGQPTPNAVQKKPLLSTSEILGVLNAQLASESVDRTARFLLSDDIPLVQKIEVMQKLMDDASYGFTHEDVVQLILAVANGFKPASDEQHQIFKLFADNFDKIQETRPLVTAAQNGYINTLDSLVKWAVHTIDRYKQLGVDEQAFKFLALEFAIDRKADVAFDTIIRRLGGLDEVQATELAWRIVKTRGKPRFLSEAKRLGANLNSVRDGKTLLIYAVIDRNLPMVKELLILGANPEQFVDPEVGTAVQQAFSLGFKEIETFLRDQGAREESAVLTEF